MEQESLGNPLTVAIVSAIVLGHSFNKRVEISLVKIVFSFVLITRTRSPRYFPHFIQGFDCLQCSH